jgi:DNA-binding IclR family transcriptional regulator
MAYSYEDLKRKTIEELREIAKGIEHEAVQGYTQMNKEHLLPALCKALGIETHAHHHVVGLDKQAVKARMRKLRDERVAALQAHDRARLKAIRRELHRLNRRIRAATV